MGPTIDILFQLNSELANLVASARQSLVRIQTAAPGRSQRSNGVGAGTIWHPDGLILTNAHVATGDPQVTLPDGQVLRGQLLAMDRELDLAALTVEAANLLAIPLGDSKQLQPGDWVVALGHPWNLEGAATAGVVAGLGAGLPEMPTSAREWIAVGLRLRPGNSGGPLLDSSGQLVGINTIMVGPEIGLAVPVHVIKRFLKRHLGRATA